MTDKEIVERAKKAEKETVFGELVHSPISKGVNSAYGIGFIEGMVEYRNSLQKEPASEDLEEAVNAYIGYAPEIDECSSVYGKRKAFRAGANWQREQLMRNAIEVVISDDTTICNAVELMKLQEKYQGQKVKIAIIKEE